MNVASCWHRRSKAEDELFREAIAALCTTYLQQSGVLDCNAHYLDEDRVTVETTGDETYFMGAPPAEVCRRIYELARLAEYDGTFRW